MKYLKEKLNKLISQSKFNKSLRKKLEHGEL